MSLTESISQAIATMEGFFKPGSVAERNNNPGNLRSWGTRPIANGYAVFESPEAGWAALRQQVNLNIGRGLSLQEFFGGKPGVYAGYAPAADKNDPTGYAVYVATRVGLDPSIPLNSVPVPGEPQVFALIGSDDGVSEAGVIEWPTLALLGLVGLGLWLAFSD